MRIDYFNILAESQLSRIIDLSKKLCKVKKQESDRKIHICAINRKATIFTPSFYETRLILSAQAHD